MINSALRGNPSHQRWLQVFLEKTSSLKPEQKIEELVEALPDAWQQVAGWLGVDDYALARKLGAYYGFDVCKPEELIDAPAHAIPEEVIRRFSVVPVSDDGRVLALAVSNPFDSEMLSLLSFAVSRALVLKLCPPAALQQWIKQHLQEVVSEKIILAENARESEQEQDSKVAHSDSAISKLVNHMLAEACRRNASDIHIEPFCGCGEVRYRIDGLLTRVATLPKLLFEHMVRRVKAISHMNVANSLIPQDGRSSLKIDEQYVDLRVSSIPVSGGEKIVIRLLRQAGVVSLDEIGIVPRELETLRSMLQRPSGIFIMTGPTGSGKSTTLYSALSEVNTFERCLVTVEDPVEYQVEGVAQININRAQDVTFANALRAILRQDPDIVLVGEIRDEETARITLRAAITGHFVMSTLHTRDAITAIPRLIDLGIPEASVADALTGLAAQRLLRKLCSECIVESSAIDPLEKEFLRRYPGVQLHSGRGCQHCGDSGYRGRFPILELVLVDRKLADGIRNHAPTSELRNFARQSGSRSLSELAREAVASGRTSVMEAHRVLGSELWE